MKFIIAGCCLALLLAGCKSRGPSSTSVPVAESPVRTCQALPAAVNRCDVQAVPESKGYIVAGDVMTAEGVIRNGAIHVIEEQIIAVGCLSALKVATLVNCSGSVITPGFLNAHDHLGYNSLPPGGQRSADSKYAHCNEPGNAYSDPECVRYQYDRRNEWRLGLGNKVKVLTTGRDGKEPALVWNELRHAMAATTTVAGSEGSKGLVRNPDRPGLSEGDLGVDATVTYNTFPLGDNDGQAYTDSCKYPKVVDPGSLKKGTFLPHVAEGADRYAHNEVLCLSGRGTNPDSRGVDVLAARTTFIHAIAVNEKDARLMASTGTSVVWSPRSNISLYGSTAPVSRSSNFASITGTTIR